MTLDDLVVNVRSGKPYDVLVDRSTKWGNPFPIGMRVEDARARLERDGVPAQLLSGFGLQRGKLDREQAIACHELWFETRYELVGALHELRGKVLGCWCAPHGCHARTLAKAANPLRRVNGVWVLA